MIENIKLGTSRCKCQTCGRVFSSDSAFQKHRVTVTGLSGRACATPEAVGLELKSWGGYGGVGSDWRSDV